MAMQAKYKPNALNLKRYMSNIYILKQPLIHGLAVAVGFAISPLSHIVHHTFIQLIPGPEKEKNCKLKPSAHNRLPCT